MAKPRPPSEPTPLAIEHMPAQKLSRIISSQLSNPVNNLELSDPTQHTSELLNAFHTFKDLAIAEFMRRGRDVPGCFGDVEREVARLQQIRSDEGEGGGKGKKMLGFLKKLKILKGKNKRCAKTMEEKLASQIDAGTTSKAKAGESNTQDTTKDVVILQDSSRELVSDIFNILGRAKSQSAELGAVIREIERVAITLRDDEIQTMKNGGEERDSDKTVRESRGLDSQSSGSNITTSPPESSVVSQEPSITEDESQPIAKFFKEVLVGVSNKDLVKNEGDDTTEEKQPRTSTSYIDRSMQTNARNSLQDMVDSLQDKIKTLEKKHEQDLEAQKASQITQAKPCSETAHVDLQAKITLLEAEIKDLKSKHSEATLIGLRKQITTLKAEVIFLKTKHEKDLELREPLLQVGIKTRRRFMELTKRLNQGGDLTVVRGKVDNSIIEAGNEAAHRGNVLADGSLFALRILTAESDRREFKEIYDLDSNRPHNTQSILSRCLKGLEFYDLYGTMSSCLSRTQYTVSKVNDQQFASLNSTFCARLNLLRSQNGQLSIAEESELIDADEKIETCLVKMRKIVEETLKADKRRRRD